MAWGNKTTSRASEFKYCFLYSVEADKKKCINPEGKQLKNCGYVNPCLSVPIVRIGEEIVHILRGLDCSLQNI